MKNEQRRSNKIESCWSAAVRTCRRQEKDGILPHFCIARGRQASGKGWAGFWQIKMHARVKNKKEENPLPPHFICFSLHPFVSKTGWVHPLSHCKGRVPRCLLSACPSTGHQDTTIKMVVLLHSPHFCFLKWWCFLGTQCKHWAPRKDKGAFSAHTSTRRHQCQGACKHQDTTINRVLCLSLSCFTFSGIISFNINSFDIHYQQQYGQCSSWYGINCQQQHWRCSCWFFSSRCTGWWWSCSNCWFTTSYIRENLP